MFLMTDDLGQAGAQAMVEPWAGDSFIVYEQDGGACMVATIVFEPASELDALGKALIDALGPTFPEVTVVVRADNLTLRTCAAN